ncbi:MAG: dipeptidase [Candidatus Aminicenantaceae bacterium]
MDALSESSNHLHDRSLVIDLHVHPSLKTYLFNKKLSKRHKTGGAWNPLTLRVDLPKIIEGGVNAVFSSIYLPEKKMINDCWFLKLLKHFVGKKLRGLVRDNPFDVTMKILKHFEQAVSEAKKDGKTDAEIAKSVSDLYRILDAKNIAFIHSIEGGHSLEGKIENLRAFFDQGVALLTLAHFYENEVVCTVGGIPENKKFLFCFKNEKEQSCGLSEFGRKVIEEMIRLGMLIDLTHCTPLARDEIYQINNKKRPLILSHVGVHAKNPKAMNPEDDEIKTIADCGGVIGIIFMNYWLHPEEKKNGMDLIINTIKHIKKIGGIESIAIGSDFDGFTDPPDDIKDISEMPKLTYNLLKSGFSEEEIEKILSKNILRIIKDGWGKQ